MKRLLLVPALALVASCGPPTATVVEEPGGPAKPTATADATEPAPPEVRDDGMLMPPDILNMPSETEMRPSVDDEPGSAVIASPPRDPAEASGE